MKAGDAEANTPFNGSQDPELDDTSFDLEIEDPLEQQGFRFNSYSRNRFIAFIQKLLEGPEVPRDEPPQIKGPLLGQWEQWPAIVHHRFPRRIRIAAVVGYLCAWYILVHSIMRPSFSHGPRVKDSDIEVITLSCSGDGYFWKGKNEACGLSGEECTPFEDREVIVNCPALCDRTWVWAATPVGDEMVKYRQYAIGGGALDDKSEDGVLTHPYRADSFPCGSAVHAGLVSPYSGGCVRMSFNGNSFKFEASEGSHGTGWSVSFPSFFPSSFVFKELPAGVSGCFDPRFVVLTLNFILGAPVVYLCSGLVSYWVLTIVGFWTITITLDPPLAVNPEDVSSVAELISTGFARMLPLCFVLYALWKGAVKRTFADGSSPIVKLFIWYPLFWIGTANVITFDRLPLDRFTASDIAQQKGALATAVSVAFLITGCVVVQGIQVWRSGRFVHYLILYAVIILSCVMLASLPNLQLRIHHYILALILIPGTSTRGTTAYAIQGVLLGLLLSGVARWDFASIVETHVSLLRGEAGAAAPPPTDIYYERDILRWNTTWPDDSTPDPRLDGVSITINDIEYFREDTSHKNINQLVFHEDIKPMLFDAKDALGDVPLYIRIARASTTDRDVTGDYSRAALLTWPGGNFTPPEEGRS